MDESRFTGQCRTAWASIGVVGLCVFSGGVNHSLNRVGTLMATATVIVLNVTARVSLLQRVRALA